MKRLIHRAIYHPLIALTLFCVVDVMHNVDYSPAAALLVLTVRSVSRVLSLLDRA